MRKLLIVVGPLAGAGFLALPASEDRANAGQDGSQPSFGTESPRTGGELAVSPRDGCSYEPGDTARTTWPSARNSILLGRKNKFNRRRGRMAAMQN